MSLISKLIAERVLSGDKEGAREAIREMLSTLAYEHTLREEFTQLGENYDDLSEEMASLNEEVLKEECECDDPENCDCEQMDAEQGEEESEEEEELDEAAVGGSLTYTQRAMLDKRWNDAVDFGSPISAWTPDMHAALKDAGGDRMKAAKILAAKRKKLQEELDEIDEELSEYKGCCGEELTEGKRIVKRVNSKGKIIRKVKCSAGMKAKDGKCVRMDSKEKITRRKALIKRGRTMKRQSGSKKRKALMKRQRALRKRHSMGL